MNNFFIKHKKLIIVIVIVVIVTIAIWSSVFSFSKTNTKIIAMIKK